MDALLADIKAMALRCGEIHLLYFGRSEANASVKSSAHDLLTKADLECDEYLRRTFAEKYPRAGVITEEGENIPANPEPGESEMWFCADPLDGTNNFASGCPHFSVSIGVLDGNHEPLAGVIYDPCTRELCWGTRGGGSFMESPRGIERLVCSRRTELAKCVLGTAISMFDNPPLTNADSTQVMVKHCVDVSERGSCCLDMCDVATGRCDGYWAYGPHIWDIAAGWVIAAESGCVVTRLDGAKLGRDNLHTPHIGFLCAPPAIHEQMAEIVKEFPVMERIKC